MLKAILGGVLGLACVFFLNGGTAAAKGGKGGGGHHHHHHHGHHHHHHGHHHHHHHHYRPRPIVIVPVEVAPVEMEVPEPEDIEAAEYGVVILELAKGPANSAGLEEGDIILAFNGRATPSFEALAAAVQASGTQARVLVLREESGKRETVTLTGINGRIGVTGRGVRVE
jgi:hypothetical protein